MDPRHPQNPYSHNSGSSYSRAPFQPSSSQAPFPPSSHPPSATPLYPEHQRRTSENSFYAPPPSYARDGAPMPNTGHTRHTSASSIGTPLNRNMPPPSPPQAQQQQSTHAQHPSYGPPPPPSLSRGPPPSLGPPMSLSASRDLPSLSSIQRPGSVNSSMSISAMLGGPPPATRESTQPTSQYSTPAPGASSSYSTPRQSSPRLSTAGSDYGRYRRPQTPEHARVHESQGVRDHRANSAGSPPGAGSLGTPESHRYATPQGYGQRNPPPAGDDRRDQYPVRVPNPNSVAPVRPSSQPAMFNASSSRGPESSRPDPYGRPFGFGERDEMLRERARYEEELALRRERERELERERDRELTLQRERERVERERERERELERERERQREIERERERERERLDRRDLFGDRGPFGRDISGYGRQYGSHQSAPYSGPESRDAASWMRPREEPTREQGPAQQSQASVSGGFDFPRAQSYGGPSAYSQESRYPSGSYGQTGPHSTSTSGPQYESPTQERQRLAQSQHSQHAYGSGPPGSQRLQESPRSRANEEAAQQMQRGVYLGIQQEINRKGRSSPFPQAVQGAQGQLSGPGGEPGIKSEFGKMFSGIGSGVGSLGATGTASGGSQTPFSNPGQFRREDLENLSLDSLNEIGGHKMALSSSRDRRKKLKEEDSRDGDESVTGRQTPTGRNSKRAKPTQPQQVGVLNRNTSNGSRQDITEATSSPTAPQPGLIPFKNPGIGQVVPSPPILENKVIPHHHHINRHHHHHHHVGQHHKPAPVVIPKPKQIIHSNSVLESVADLPRQHLGHFLYQSHLKEGQPPSMDHSPFPRRGFASTPEPLPRFEGQENCTLTVRIPRIYLTPDSREEITSRRSVWGTDVYTDDSDVIAACIHSGWIRGAWPIDVDVSMLDLVIDPAENKKNGTVSNGDEKEKEKEKEKEVDKDVTTTGMKDLTFEEPPARGPIEPLKDHDLHVTVLILPALENYSSTTRWGIRSRSWSKTHDGLSFKIMKMKWVTGVDTAKEGRGQARRMRLRAALEDAEQNEEEFFRPLPTQGNGFVEETVRTDGVVQESFIRTGDGPLSQLTGLGTKSWWKKEKVNGKPKEESTEMDKAMDDAEPSVAEVAMAD